MSIVLLRACTLGGPTSRSLANFSQSPRLSVSFSAARGLHTTQPCQDLIPLRRRRDVTAIKWDVKPTQFNSGDKESVPKPDLQRLRPGFEHCKELQDAHPDVRRLCSMEFGTGNERRNQLEGDLIRKVQRFASDFDSIEVRIARITAQIRVSQIHAKVPIIGTHHGWNMSLLLEAVQRRKRYLRRLRAWDYNKFCWVLEQLNIDYIMLGNLIRTTRKDIAQGLVQKQALEIRRDKFKAYHEQLKAKQGDFLVRQERELAEISEEEKVLLAELKSLKNKKDVVVQ